MPLTEEMLRKIASVYGMRLSEVEAMNGGRLSSSQRKSYDLACGIAKVRKAANSQKQNAGTPKSTAERVHDLSNRNSAVKWRECENPARRKRLEACPEKWLRYYFPAIFYRPFEAPHHAIIDGSTNAIRTGERFAVAAERGIGKSAIEWALALKDAFTGKSIFPAYVPWEAGAVKRAFRFWRTALCHNPRLLADYPEFCAPFAHSRGVSQRLAATWWDGGPRNGEATGAQIAITDGIIVFPDSRGAIGSSTINGNPRGLNHPTPDGRVLRPTSAILDDVQDRSVAKSARMVEDTVSIIDGDVAGMGEAGVKLPMLMTGNCIEPGDVMAHYLEADQWHAIRVPCVVSWPEGWDDGNGPTAKLWETWHTKYKAKDKHRQYYKTHKATMVNGFELSAPKVFAGKKEFPDAFCGVMESYFRMGKEAFHAEKQQKPLDPLEECKVRATPALLLSRAVGPPRGVAPEEALNIVAGADINPGTQSRLGARITWACASFAMHQTESVMAYGIHELNMPKDPTPSQQVSVIYAGLNELRIKLHAEYSCTMLGYDARGWYNKGVTRGQALRYRNIELRGTGCAAIGMEGWPSDTYRPTHKTAIKQFEQCHLARDTVEQARVEWIAWNTDWHNLQQLNAWIATPGAPGSCVLYAGNHDAEFLQQATTRAFMGMVQKYKGQVYDWVRTPGSDDYGDCLAMCRALAARHGIGTGEFVEQAKKKFVAVVGRPSHRR